MFCFLKNYIPTITEHFCLRCSNLLVLCCHWGSREELLIYKMKKNMAKISPEMSMYHKNSLYLYTFLPCKSKFFIFSI